MQYITIINIIFCFIILFIGVCKAVISRRMVYLFIAIGFGLFGISHFFSLAGIGQIAFVRILAYLAVLWAIFSS